MKMPKVAMDRQELHRRLDLWLDGLEAKQPQLCDGEEHVFHLSGGVDGHHNDEALMSFALTTSRTESGL